MTSLITKGYFVSKGFFARHEFFSAALFFILLVIIFFAPVVFSGKTLTTSIFSGGVMSEGPYKYDGTRPIFSPLRDPGAFNWQDEPLSNYIGGILKNEYHLPLWNSNMGAGYPILAGFHLGLLSPLNYIPFLFSSQLAWDIAFLIKFFLAGFLTYIFARKIRLEKKPSLLAAVIFMFSGYAMVYLNMPHFSVEILIPLVLLSFEHFLERQTVGRFLLSVIAIVLTILPGMPEATFFVLLIGSFWFIFSLFFIHREIISKTRLIFLFITINFAAIALTAVQLLPFFEFLKLSINSHASTFVGQAFIPFGTAASIFYPYLFYPLYSWVGFFYYIGMAGIILFFISILSIKKFEKIEKGKIIFFGLFAFFMLSKVFGFSFVNWMGSLPILKTLIFPKYAAPAIIFSIAIVSAYGYSLILRERISFLNTKIVLILITIISITFFTLHEYSSHIINRLSETDPLAKHILVRFIEKTNFDIPSYFVQSISSLTIPFLAFVIIADLIIFLFFWIIILNTNRKVFPAASLLIFVFLELYIYALPIERPDRYDTFKKPPYINYLQLDGAIFRVYGQMPNDQNSMLYPNTSSAYGIQDIRTIMALEDARYFTFLENVLDVKSTEISNNRFTGNSQIPFDNKFFDLLNVKYFLSPPGTSDYTIVNQIASEVKLLSGNVEFFKPGSAELNEKQLQGFMLHAPSKIEFPLRVENKHLIFQYGIAETGIKNSDGVQFSVSMRNENGKEIQLLTDTINPQDKKYKKWQRVDLDLSAYAGKNIILSFQTDPGKNNAFDQFFFGNFESPKDNVVYDKEMTIIENKNVFPRAFVVHRAEKISDPDKIFARLKADDFDIRNRIIIEKDLPENMLNTNNAPEKDNSTAMITNYKDQEVLIDAKMENDGFLVLTDQYYPGWKAFVDGKETEIYPTDYTFRSIYLEKGSRAVRFVYDPWSYKAGKYISIATLLFLLGMLFYEKKINIALK